MNRFVGTSYGAVDLDPTEVFCGQDLAHGLPDHRIASQPGQLLEGRVHVQEPEIARFAVLVADDLVEGEPFGHLVEQEAKTLVLRLQLDLLRLRFMDQLFRFRATAVA